MKVLIINGPNLNRLDIRDSKVYGDLNYPQLVDYIVTAANKLDLEADVRQSNEESEIIGWLQVSWRREGEGGVGATLSGFSIGPETGGEVQTHEQRKRDLGAVWGSIKDSESGGNGGYRFRSDDVGGGGPGEIVSGGGENFFRHQCLGSG